MSSPSWPRATTAWPPTPSVATDSSGSILAAVESAEPRDGVEAMAERAARDAESAFGFIAAEVLFVDPDSIEPEERIPGVSVPIRAELRAGDERMGLILASLPATRDWERADQTLLDLYASEIGVAIRNAELFSQVQDQNRQLRQPERGEGRLPARRQPQPPDAADLDPSRTPTRSAATDRRSRA